MSFNIFIFLLFNLEKYMCNKLLDEIDLYLSSYILHYFFSNFELLFKMGENSYFTCEFRETFDVYKLFIYNEKIIYLN